MITRGKVTLFCAIASVSFMLCLVLNGCTRSKSTSGKPLVSIGGTPTSPQQPNGTPPSPSVEQNASVEASTPPLPAPDAPKLTSPTGAQITNNSSILACNGACTAGNTVILSGGDFQSKPCEAGAFTFEVKKTTDETFVFNLIQVDPAQTHSAAVSFTWTRDTAAPSKVSILTPAVNPYVSGDSSFNLAGLCEAGAEVALAGALTANQTCKSDGSYSFTIDLIKEDGTYLFSLLQKDKAGNISPSITFTWTRDTSLPSAPQIQSPAANPFYSSNSTLNITGSCIMGAKVNLKGSEIADVLCGDNGTFNFAISKSNDGSYDFNVTQTNLSGTQSAASSLRWIKDSVSPAAPVLAFPMSNPLTSSDSTLSLSGACEPFAKVSIAEDDAPSTPSSEDMCIGSWYSLDFIKTIDGVYPLTITQVDLAGNASSATHFTWIRDTSVPATPTITQPSNAATTSNTSQVSIAGICQSGNSVTLSGASDQTTTCANSTYSFNSSKDQDGTYWFAVSQTNPAGTTSAAANLTWIRDTQTPTPPTITNPASSPVYSNSTVTLSGKCLSNATVYLTGDATASTLCVSQSYSFEVSKSVDGTYNFSISQISLAGNPSPAAPISWIRTSTMPSTPTLTSLAQNPITTNTSTLPLAGGCNDGHTVTVSGDLTQTQLCNQQSYGFVVSKTLDGVYTFAIRQTSPSGINSGLISVQWTRDTVLPVTTITSTPPGQNLATSASFSFSTSKTNTIFQCRIDGAAYSNCLSPTSFSTMPNGTHTFEAFSADLLGNQGPTKSHTWNQEAYNTLALYHFDSNPGPTLDSSAFTGALHNTLTDNGTTAGSAAKFGNSRRFTAAASQSMQAPDTAALQLSTKTLTAEAFVRLGSLPTTTTAYTLVSKSDTSPQMGWVFKLKKISTSYYLSFGASLNGSTITWKNSSAITVDITKFHHVAVTWNQGTVKFYYDGLAKGSATIGTAGSAALFKSTAPLRIGASSSGENLDGDLDELRISQILRGSSKFSVPTEAYSPE
ncbi:LamG-like jellyroll fold domain-containing protein [Bdellovibrionota bacterium FG-2]